MCLFCWVYRWGFKGYIVAFQACVMQLIGDSYLSPARGIFGFGGLNNSVAGE